MKKKKDGIWHQASKCRNVAAAKWLAAAKSPRNRRKTKVMAAIEIINEMKLINEEKWSSTKISKAWKIISYEKMKPEMAENLEIENHRKAKINIRNREIIEKIIILSMKINHHIGYIRQWPHPRNEEKKWKKWSKSAYERKSENNEEISSPSSKIEINRKTLVKNRKSKKYQPHRNENNNRSHEIITKIISWHIESRRPKTRKYNTATGNQSASNVERGWHRKWNRRKSKSKHIGINEIKSFIEIEKWKIEMLK